MMLLAKVWQDVRFGARHLVKRRSYSLPALTTLVLTVAAVTTMFTIVRQVLLQPLPAPRPGELVSVEIRNSQTGDAQRSESIPFSTFVDWQVDKPADAELAWAVIESSVLTESDVGVYSAGHYVSHNFLRTIGIEPVMGRWFTAEDAGAPGRHNASQLPRCCGAPTSSSLCTPDRQNERKALSRVSQPGRSRVSFAEAAPPQA